MKPSYLLVPALLQMTGCVMTGPNAGPTQYSSENVQLDDSELVRVDLNMGAGELRVTDGAAKLARADFAFNIASWKPEVRYTREGKQGVLHISQPGNNHSTFVGQTKYSWDLQLNKNVPYDVAVHFGAGKAKLDLSALDLRGLELNMGVGELDVDLRGAPKHSYNVSINGGIGQATVRVSSDTAVWAEAHGGIGGIKVRGLQNESGHWVSPSYDTAANKIRIDVQGGIGQINLIAD